MKIEKIIGLLILILISLLTYNFTQSDYELKRRRDISSNCNKFAESDKREKSKKYIENVYSLCRSNYEKLIVLENQK